MHANEFKVFLGDILFWKKQSKIDSKYLTGAINKSIFIVMLFDFVTNPGEFNITATPPKTNMCPEKWWLEDYFIYFPFPSLPKSPKYLVSRCLDPLKAFSGGVCGSKHLLTRYLED